MWRGRLSREATLCDAAEWCLHHVGSDHLKAPSSSSSSLHPPPEMHGAALRQTGGPRTHLLKPTTQISSIVCRVWCALVCFTVRSCSGCACMRGLFLCVCVFILVCALRLVSAGALRFDCRVVLAGLRLGQQPQSGRRTDMITGRERALVSSMHIAWHAYRRNGQKRRTCHIHSILQYIWYMFTYIKDVFMCSIHFKTNTHTRCRYNMHLCAHNSNLAACIPHKTYIVHHSQWWWHAVFYPSNALHIKHTHKTARACAMHFLHAAAVAAAVAAAPDRVDRLIESAFNGCARERAIVCICCTHDPFRLMAYSGAGHWRANQTRHNSDSARERLSPLLWSLNVPHHIRPGNCRP